MKRHYIGGFEVLSGATQRQTGVVRCVCGRTMSNSLLARESHRGECQELQRLERMAENAVQRAQRRGP